METAEVTEVEGVNAESDMSSVFPVLVSDEDLAVINSDVAGGV